MLYKETIKGETFQLLERLMQDSRLQGFNLAGGTALALYMGHRISIDLDLFTQIDFDAFSLGDYLQKQYKFEQSFCSRNTLKGEIDGVKIDCITYNYENLTPPLVTKEGVRLYGIKDLAAMKLSAIAGNGSRVKDFIDIACLSTKMSFNDMLESFQCKFKHTSSVQALRAMAIMSIKFHDDINHNEPIMLTGHTYKWDLIRSRIENMIMKPDKIFHSFPFIEQ